MRKIFANSIKYILREKYAIAFIVIIIVFFWQIILFPSTYTLRFVDNVGYADNTLKLLKSFQTTPFFYSGGLTETYLIFASPFGQIIALFIVGITHFHAIAVINYLIVLNIILMYLFTYRFIYHQTNDERYSFLGGLIASLSPFIIATGWFNFFGLFFVPLILEALYDIIMKDGKCYTKYAIYLLGLLISSTYFWPFAFILILSFFRFSRKYLKVITVSFLSGISAFCFYAIPYQFSGIYELTSAIDLQKIPTPYTDFLQILTPSTINPISAGWRYFLAENTVNFIPSWDFGNSPSIQISVILMFILVLIIYSFRILIVTRFEKQIFLALFIAFIWFLGDRLVIGGNDMHLFLPFHYIQELPLATIFRKPTYMIYFISFLLGIIISITLKRARLKNISLILIIVIPVIVLESYHYNDIYPKTYLTKDYTNIKDIVGDKNVLMLPNTKLNYFQYSYIANEYNINIVEYPFTFNAYKKDYFKYIEDDCYLKNLVYSTNNSCPNGYIHKFNFILLNKQYTASLEKKDIELDDKYLVNKNYIEYNNLGRNIYENNQFILYAVEDSTNKADLESKLLIYGAKTEYIKTDSYYKINILIGRGNDNIVFLQSFHPGWHLYLEPYAPLDCGSGAMTYSGTIDTQNPPNPLYQVGSGTTGQKTRTGIYLSQGGDTLASIARSHTGMTLTGIVALNPGITLQTLRQGTEIIVSQVQTPHNPLSQGATGAVALSGTGEIYHVTECPSENRFYAGGELSKLWEKPIFDDTHKMVYDYANQWTIDPTYIRANYPKEYYHENPDGSIDVRMTLYFKPQSYFYLGLIISTSAFLVLLGYLGYSVYRTRKTRLSTIKKHDK